MFVFSDGKNSEYFAYLLGEIPYNFRGNSLKSQFALSSTLSLSNNRAIAYISKHPYPTWEKE